MPPRPTAVRPRSFLLVLPLLSVTSSAPPAAARASQPCEDWNSPGYFDRATAEEATACLEAGSDPNARDDWGYSPLHYAAWMTDDPAVIVALAEAGADPEAKLEDGSTAMHIAAWGNSNPAVVAALADAGVGVTAQDRSGYQPLWAAVLCNHANPEVIEALLDAGADPQARDPNGVSPWDVVRSTPELRDSNAYVHMKNLAGNGGDDAWGELDIATLAQYRASCELER